MLTLYPVFAFLCKTKIVLKFKKYIYICLHTYIHTLTYQMWWECTDKVPSPNNLLIMGMRHKACLSPSNGLQFPVAKLFKQDNHISCRAQGSSHSPVTSPTASALSLCIWVKHPNEISIWVTCVSSTLGCEYT